MIRDEVNESNVPLLYHWYTRQTLLYGPRGDQVILIRDVYVPVLMDVSEGEFHRYTPLEGAAT